MSLGRFISFDSSLESLLSSNEPDLGGKEWVLRSLGDVFDEYLRASAPSLLDVGDEGEDILRQFVGASLGEDVDAIFRAEGMPPGVGKEAASGRGAPVDAGTPSTTPSPPPATMMPPPPQLGLRSVIDEAGSTRAGEASMGSRPPERG